jgi:hypothetical protein
LILSPGTLLMQHQLFGCGLTDVDYGFAGEMVRLDKVRFELAHRGSLLSGLRAGPVATSWAASGAVVTGTNRLPIVAGALGETGPKFEAGKGGVVSWETSLETQEICLRCSTMLHKVRKEAEVKKRGGVVDNW